MIKKPLFIKIVFISFLIAFLSVNSLTKDKGFHVNLEGIMQDEASSKKESLKAIAKIIDDSYTGLTKAEEEKIAKVIVDESTKYNQDPFMILSLIMTESSINNWSYSEKGAIGLMQILPHVASDVARKMRLSYDGESSLYDPVINIKIGVRYFSDLLQMFGNNVGAALAAYNSGPTYISERLKNGEDIPYNFSRRVLNFYNNFLNFRMN